MLVNSFLSENKNRFSADAAWNQASQVSETWEAFWLFVCEHLFVKRASVPAFVGFFQITALFFPVTQRPFHTETGFAEVRISGTFFFFSASETFPAILTCCHLPLLSLKNDMFPEPEITIAYFRQMSNRISFAPHSHGRKIKKYLLPAVRGDMDTGRLSIFFREI